jgi:hypothetical protein
MKRPSKKEIKAAVDALKANPATSGGSGAQDNGSVKESSKKSSQRIRKQGV